MNYGIIRYIVGKMLLMEGVLLLIPTFVSLLYQESSGVYFLIIIEICSYISNIYVAISWRLFSRNEISVFVFDTKHIIVYIVRLKLIVNNAVIFDIVV